MKDIMKPASESLRTIGGGSPNGKVVIGELKRITERIDSNGNIIDPETKQIIKRTSGPDAE